MENYKLNRGEIITFSTGEYSDYGYNGSVIMLEDVDLAEFIKEHFIGLDVYGAGEIDTVASHLIAKQKALPLENREVHIGTYGRFNSGIDVFKDDDFKWSLTE